MINNKLKYSKLIRLTCCFSLLILVSCSKKDNEVMPEDPSAGDYDRTALLTNYANSYIKPAYAEYESKVSELQIEVSSFNSSLTVTALQSLKIKWENALLVWQDVAFLEFGPASNISLRAQTNVYPVDVTLIQSNISSGTYSLASGSNFDAKGFQAIDYLLFGLASTDAEIVAYYTNNANAKTYLQDVVDELKANATVVKADWDGSYTSTFIANSASNAQGSSVSDILNSLNLHYEAYIRKGKIGLPVGAFNPFSNQTLPEHVEGYYSNQSLPYVYRSLSSLKTFINGNNYITNASGEGLDDYISFVNAQTGSQPLQTVINNQFSSIQSELGNINDPLSNEVDANTSGVNAVYQKMQQMVGYLKVDMTNALEVLVTYQDSDGD
jgi:predicted lipoprotein